MENEWIWFVLLHPAWPALVFFSLCRTPFATTWVFTSALCASKTWRGRCGRWTRWSTRNAGRRRSQGKGSATYLLPCKGANISWRFSHIATDINVIWVILWGGPKHNCETKGIKQVEFLSELTTLFQVVVSKSDFLWLFHNVVQCMPYNCKLHNIGHYSSKHFSVGIGFYFRVSE